MEENSDHNNIHTVMDCLIPFINDRNTFSLICRSSYDAECKTRKHVTVYTRYATSPSRFCQRFPFLQSLTLDGSSEWMYRDDVNITQWVQQITTSLHHLNSIRFKKISLKDSDLKLLAQSRGKQLRIIEIWSCIDFSRLGLYHLAKYCNNLKDLCVVDNVIDEENGENWLRELGTGIEKLNLKRVKYDLKDLELVAKNCSRNLVSVKIDERYDFIDLVGFFSYAVNLVEFAGGKFSNIHEDEYKSFKFPDSVKHLLIRCTIDVKIIVPFAHLITELDCRDYYDCLSFYRDENLELIKSCLNLKVLHLRDEIRNHGLQNISIYCKNLRKLFIDFNSTLLTEHGQDCQVSHDGVIHIAKHCVELEYLHINVVSMTNEVMRCIGKNMKKLKDFSLYMWTEYNEIVLNNGVRSLLVRCKKLENLRIYSPEHGGRTWLTDKGLGFVGKYGGNLKYLNLQDIDVKLSDAGVMEMSKLGYQCWSYRNEELINISGRNVKGIPQPCRDIEQVDMMERLVGS